MPRGWEGNRRSGVELACVTDSSGLSTYGLNVREWEMSTPPTPQLGHGSLYLYTSQHLTKRSKVNA